MQDSAETLVVRPGSVPSRVPSARQASADFSALVFGLEERTQLSLRATIAAGGGVAIALLIPWIGPPAGIALLLVCVAAIALLHRVLSGWAVRWQRALIWFDDAQRAEISRHLPERRSAAAIGRALLVDPTTGTGSYARYQLLQVLGRDEEAAALVDELPAETPMDRFRLATAGAWRDWTSSGTLDLAEAQAAAQALEGPERAMADVSTALWQAVSASRAAGVTGRPALAAVRVAAAPPDVRLSAAQALRLWRLRVWPLEWLLGGFVAMALLLAAARLVIPGQAG